MYLEPGMRQIGVHTQMKHSRVQYECCGVTVIYNANLISCFPLSNDTPSASARGYVIIISFIFFHAAALILYPLLLTEVVW